MIETEADNLAPKIDMIELNNINLFVNKRLLTEHRLTQLDAGVWRLNRERRGRKTIHCICAFLRLHLDKMMLSNANFDVIFLLGAKLSVSVCWCQIVNFLILVSNCPILLP